LPKIVFLIIGVINLKCRKRQELSVKKKVVAYCETKGRSYFLDPEFHEPRTKARNGKSTGRRLRVQGNYVERWVVAPEEGDQGLLEFAVEIIQVRDWSDAVVFWTKAS